MMEEGLVGKFARANDGSVWFHGDLGWYPYPLDGKSWPIEDVPSGIRHVMDRPQ